MKYERIVTAIRSILLVNFLIQFEAFNDFLYLVNDLLFIPFYSQFFHSINVIGYENES